MVLLAAVYLSGLMGVHHHEHDHRYHHHHHTTAQTLDAEDHDNCCHELHTHTSAPLSLSRSIQLTKDSPRVSLLPSVSSVTLDRTFARAQGQTVPNPDSGHDPTAAERAPPSVFST